MSAERLRLTLMREGSVFPSPKTGFAPSPFWDGECNRDLTSTTTNPLYAMFQISGIFRELGMGGSYFSLALHVCLLYRTCPFHTCAKSDKKWESGLESLGDGLQQGEFLSGHTHPPGVTTAWLLAVVGTVRGISTLSVKFLYST